MDGYFRLGMVNQHKDLLKPGDSCLGGGYYHFDYTSNRTILDRSSYDFGKPKWHLLETLKVPSVYRGLRLVYFYDDDREFDVSQELQIEKPPQKSAHRRNFMDWIVSLLAGE